MRERLGGGAKLAVARGNSGLFISEKSYRGSEPKKCGNDWGGAKLAVAREFLDCSSVRNLTGGQNLRNPERLGWG